MAPALRTALLALIASAAACGDGPVFTGPERLGGVDIDAATLESGRRLYLRYCQVCHGASGDGRGPAAVGMWPQPRDFTSARFKYAGIEDRGLPDDRELERIVRGGLAGTAMQPWQLAPGELAPILQYIKTFSPPGKGFRSERLKVKRPTIPPDPYPPGAARTAAIARGEQLYHSYFECAKCHPSYVEPERFARWEATQRADEPYLPAPKWSAEYQAVLLPPDFLRHPMRSVQTVLAEGEPSLDTADLYRVIAYGLQGPMPGYGHLGAEDAWAVAHYIQGLGNARLRAEGTDLAAKMREWASRRDK